MKKKSIFVSVLSIFVVIGTFSFCIYENNKSKLVDVTANVTEDFSALSNKKFVGELRGQITTNNQMLEKKTKE